MNISITGENEVLLDDKSDGISVCRMKQMTPHRDQFVMHPDVQPDNRTESADIARVAAQNIELHHLEDSPLSNRWLLAIALLSMTAIAGILWGTNVKDDVRATRNAVERMAPCR